VWATTWGFESPLRHHHPSSSHALHRTGGTRTGPGRRPGREDERDLAERKSPGPHRNGRWRDRRASCGRVPPSAPPSSFHPAISRSLSAFPQFPDSGLPHREGKTVDRFQQPDPAVHPFDPIAGSTPVLPPEFRLRPLPNSFAQPIGRRSGTLKNAVRTDFAVKEVSRGKPHPRPAGSEPAAAASALERDAGRTASRATAEEYPDTTVHRQILPPSRSWKTAGGNGETGAASQETGSRITDLQPPPGRFSTRKLPPAASRMRRATGSPIPGWNSRGFVVNPSSKMRGKMSP